MSSKNKVVRAKLIQLRVSSFSLRDISVKNRNGVKLKGAFQRNPKGRKVP
eukprot:13445.XXX_881898_882047_1 [CDS] Oithona nana genome sequencing.